MSAEAEHYQTASHQLESEGSNMRLELMTRDSEARRMRDKNDTLEREIQEVYIEDIHRIRINFLTSLLAFQQFSQSRHGNFSIKL